jgi:NarL family two-component system sensor histidine kinase YdfH
MVLTIRDTGIGFDPNKVRKKEGLGLGSIRERVRLIRGALSIDSSPGKGTTIEVTIPLQGEANE